MTGAGPAAGTYDVVSPGRSDLGQLLEGRWRRQNAVENAPRFPESTLAVLSVEFSLWEGDTPTA